MSATSRKAATAARRTAKGRDTILALHGPNLNLLGTREPDSYGHDTREDVNCGLPAQAEAADVPLKTFRGNDEGALFDRIHAVRTESVRFIGINPAGYAHTSVVLHNAPTGVNIPFVEPHLTNLHAREDFRHHCYLSDKTVGTIVGLRTRGYEFVPSFALGRPGA